MAQKIILGIFPKETQTDEALIHLKEEGFESEETLVITREDKITQYRPIHDLTGTVRSEYQPSTEQENEFIAEHGFEEYSKWCLGEDQDEKENTKGSYKFPCRVISAENRAGQYKYKDIEEAVDSLHRMMDKS